MGILSSDTGDSDKDKESDKENLEVDYVIASLDDIIEKNPYSRIGMKKGIGEVGLLFDFFGDS
jgi:hypothetical protein